MSIRKIFAALVAARFKTKPSTMQTANQTKIGMTYRKLPYTAKLAVINSRLRQGDVVKVAERTGFSPNYTSEVIGGLYTNTKIVNKAFDMTRGRIKNSQLV
jgi:hypothetical protein